MSTKGGKWVSQRVQQHQQQGGPVLPPAPTQGVRNSGPGAKIMEDSAIAAQRIKENQMGATGNPPAEVPAATVFERQEATDALSNLSHNADSTPYELQEGEPAFVPAQTREEFNEKMMKELEGIAK